MQNIHYGKGNMTTPISRDEKIYSLKEDIRISEVLIHQAQDLLNPDSPCSFQVYLQEIDKKAKAIKIARRELIARYDAASNGEIPKLQQHILKLQEKLSQFGIEHQRKTKRIARAHDLRQRIIDLEEELRNATDCDIEEMINEL